MELMSLGLLTRELQAEDCRCVCICLCFAENDKLASKMIFLLRFMLLLSYIHVPLSEACDMVLLLFYDW